MKFVKANLDLLICGLIVVLALGAWYWPIGAWADAKRTEALGRNKVKNDADALIFNSNKPIDLPGYGKIPGPDEKNAMVTYTDNLVEAKANAQGVMQTQAERVAALASQKNYKNRVEVEKSGGGKGVRYVPLLSGDPKGPDNLRREDRFLPEGTANPLAFKAHYEIQFSEWAKRLGYTPFNLADEIKDALKTEELAKRHNAPVGPGGLLAEVTLTAEETSRIKKGVISNRAAAIPCYVDDTAFQKRPWLTSPTPPTAMEIFEAFVDSWLQNDVVTAITEVNKTELAKKLSDQRNVGSSPIKRLEQISIGGSGQGEGSGPGGGGNQGGAIFINMGSTGLAGASAVVTQSLTGHTDNKDYDVVWMTLKLDLDPAFLNKFIETLYRQNNGYTVLNIRTTYIDPLDAASNGLLYGDTQCVHVEILVEDILLRAWTTPLMPQALRTSLGLGPIPAK